MENQTVPSTDVTEPDIPKPTSPEPSDGQEECLICFEIVSKLLFLILPCQFGHRFMQHCILGWLRCQRLFCQASCPLCREEFRYKLCGHLLEIPRITEENRELLVEDLASDKCLICRDEERGQRRLLWRKQILEQLPSPMLWSRLEPGDLLPAAMYERLTPDKYKNVFLEVKQQHEDIYNGWHDEANNLQYTLDLDQDADGWSEYWRLKSKIAEYDRVAQVSSTMTSEEVFYNATLDDDDDTTDDETVDHETVDDETVDDETVDDEMGDDSSELSEEP